MSLMLPPARAALRPLFVCAALGALLSTPALAEVTTTDFTGASELVLEDFIGTVTVEIGGPGSIGVTIDDRDGGKEPVLVEQTGETVRLYSREEPDGRNFWRRIDWRGDGNEAFERFLDDYPVITITVPEGTDITSSGLAALVDIGDTMASLSIKDTIYLEGSVGDLSTADIAIKGAGDLVLAGVTGSMRSDIHGSGSLAYDRVGSARITIAGSGDVSTGPVDGTAKISIRGSGDVETGPIGSDAELSIQGSGDIRTGAISGGADLAVQGSGDIEVAAVNGKTAVSIHGSGDVMIEDGEALDMQVSVNGSGDLEFGGVATNPDVRVSGSGDVFIRDYTGNVNTRGSGDMTIGNIVIDD